MDKLVATEKTQPTAPPLLAVTRENCNARFTIRRSLGQIDLLLDVNGVSYSCKMHSEQSGNGVGIASAMPKEFEKIMQVMNISYRVQHELTTVTNEGGCRVEQYYYSEPGLGGRCYINGVKYG